MSQGMASETGVSMDVPDSAAKPAARNGFPDFRRMFGSVGTESFFSDYWQRQCFATRLAGVDLTQILNEIGPLDIVRLADMASEGARAWVANEFIAHSVLPVDGQNAKTLFGIGATLYFVDIPLKRLTDGLADFLGAPRQKIIASIFLTPPSGGASAHFDRNENFTFQLTGKKQWIVSNAPMIAAPPDGYILGQPVPPSLKDLFDPAIDLPTRTIEVQAGTMIYVPRGTVHNTSADEASWSLNLSYTPSMWMDLIRVGLQRRLVSSSRWRSTVSGVGDTCDIAARQTNLLSELIAEMRETLNDPERVQKLCKDFFDHPNG